MKIGELASLTGAPIETIRFYERERLMPLSSRTTGNYRIYTAEQAERLAFIRHCRSLDMKLDEIRVLLRLREQPLEACAEVNRLLDEHIGHVAERMRELQSLEKQLKALRQRCLEASTTGDCGILSQLSRDAGTAKRRSRAKGHVQGAHGHTG